MNIQSTKHRPQPRPTITPTKVEEKLTLPRDMVDLTPVSERPSVGATMLGAGVGAVGGAALGGFAGIASVMVGGAADIFLGTSHGQVANSELALTVTVAAIGGAVVGGLLAGFGSRSDHKQENALREFYSANNVSRAESPTFKEWNQLNTAGWTERETIPDQARPVLTEILRDMEERGLEFNAESPQEALAKLERRKLEVEGAKVSRIADLQNVDAVNGGGFVILSDARRETLDTLGKMHREGFKLGYASTYGDVMGQDIRELYDRFEFGSSDKKPRGIHASSSDGAVYRVRTNEDLALLHRLEGSGDSTLPPLATEAKQLHDDGLRIGVEGGYEMAYSSGAFGTYINLQKQGDVTHLAFGDRTIAVSSERRQASTSKLKQWGLSESFSSLDGLTEDMKYKAYSQITPQLIENSESLEELKNNAGMAHQLFLDMGGKGRFFRADKLPNGYLRALEEKLADS